MATTRPTGRSRGTRGVRWRTTPRTLPALRGRSAQPIWMTKTASRVSFREVPSRSPFEKSLHEVPSKSPFQNRFCLFRPRSPRSTRATAPRAAGRGGRPRSLCVRPRAVDWRTQERTLAKPHLHPVSRFTYIKTLQQQAYYPNSAFGIKALRNPKDVTSGSAKQRLSKFAPPTGNGGSGSRAPLAKDVSRCAVVPWYNC